MNEKKVNADGLIKRLARLANVKIYECTEHEFVWAVPKDHPPVNCFICGGRMKLKNAPFSDKFYLWGIA